MLTSLFASLFCFAAGAQNPDVLPIAFNKTTSLIFPFAIKSVDRGSRDVLAQKAAGVENVLQLKAGRRDFTETNLTVITSDGTLHQFTVVYSASPPSLSVTIADANARDQHLILQKDAINERQIIESAKRILDTNLARSIRTHKKHQMVFALKDIYASGDLLFCRIEIRNRSAINYGIKSLKFFVTDKKKMKRTSSQQIEIVPLFIANDTDHIGCYGSSAMIVAVRKFTIPDRKKLEINLFEANGGRNLRLEVSNRDILKSNPLPPVK